MESFFTDFRFHFELSNKLLETSSLEIKPISCVDDLFHLVPDLDFVTVFIRNIELCSKTNSCNKRKKLIVCHDYKGGYLQDRFVYGTTNLNTNNNKKPYYLNCWPFIEIFIYFSHHFVTIPPIGWINACHTNNCLVLGTIIFEWDDGRKNLETILENTNTIDHVVSILVKICEIYKFDGWLLNIECVVCKNLIGNLKNFIKKLTCTMHSSNLHSKVIWYDSIIDNGQLNWQNEFNEQNESFANLTDGIFLNYVWDEVNLNNSSLKSELNNKAVYVGIDVFGRGCKSCHGPGGLLTNIAVEAATIRNLNCAIFAPGWTIETLQIEENFLNKNNKFWENTISNYIESRISIVKLPFFTNFCHGIGNKWYHGGQILFKKQYYNLSLQSPQPIDFKAVSDKNVFSGFNSMEINGELCNLFKCCLMSKNIILEYSVFGNVEIILPNDNNCKIEYSETINIRNGWNIKKCAIINCELKQLIASGNGYIGHIQLMSYPHDQQLRKLTLTLIEYKIRIESEKRYLTGKISCDCDIQDINHFILFYKISPQNWMFHSVFFCDVYEFIDVEIELQENLNFMIKVITVPWSISDEIYLNINKE